MNRKEIKVLHVDFPDLDVELRVDPTPINVLLAIEMLVMLGVDNRPVVSGAYKPRLSDEIRCKVLMMLDRLICRISCGNGQDDES